MAHLDLAFDCDHRCDEAEAPSTRRLVAMLVFRATLWLEVHDTKRLLVAA